MKLKLKTILTVLFVIACSTFILSCDHAENPVHITKDDDEITPVLELGLTAGEGAITLDWTVEPSDIVFDHFEITYISDEETFFPEDDEEPPPVSLPNDAVTYTITDLSPRTMYTFTLKTVKKTGGTSGSVEKAAIPVYGADWSVGMNDFMLNRTVKPLLALAPAAVEIEDKDTVLKAVDAYEALPESVKSHLAPQKEHLDALLSMISQRENDYFFATGITLDKSVMYLSGINAAATLTAAVLPDNAGNTNVIWAAADASIAAQDGSGNTVTVTAKAYGTTTITVTSGEGGFSAVCEVIVSDPATLPANPNIKMKFGISSDGVEGVSDTFTALHNYLAEHGDNFTDFIHLGDYIDIPVISDFIGGTVTDTSMGGSRGRLLRLIVVGRNSFQGINDNGAIPHVVFQFQNLPINMGMGQYRSTNPGGYDSANNMINNWRNSTSGIPTEYIWAPKRIVTHGGCPPDLTAKAYESKFWLPTAWEMTGAATYSNGDYETAANQARLEYYDSNAKRIKYSPFYGIPTAYTYWLASPSVAFVSTDGVTGITAYLNQMFCSIQPEGNIATSIADMRLPIAMAFCIR